MDLFVKMVTDEWGTSYLPTTFGYGVLVILLLLILSTAALVKEHNEKVTMNTRSLVFCAVAIALAVITSNIKIFHLPTGGSVTLFSMFFVTLAGYWYGPRTGLLAGIAYGVLQLIIDPFVVHPLQLVIDYFFAFGALGLSGLFWKSKNGLIKGYLLGICGRYVFSILSGYIFFGAMAWSGWGALPYALVYNAIYIFSEGALTIVLLMVPSVAHGLESVKRLAVKQVV